MPLFTRMASNPKTAKGVSLPYEGVILHLAPHDTGDPVRHRSVCPHASEGCIASCLNTAGRGRMDSVQAARIRRTQAFWPDRDRFLWSLDMELSNLEKRAARKGVTPVARLNGTSDIAWERLQAAPDESWGQVSIMGRHPAVQFYDYTKSLDRGQRFAEGRFEAGYHLTYSKTERDSLSFTSSLVRSGVNVAVVFRHRIPETLDGLPVHDGTQHDYRFLDPRGHYIGLIALGRAKGDRTGFVMDAGRE